MGIKIISRKNLASLILHTVHVDVKLVTLDYRISFLFSFILLIQIEIKSWQRKTKSSFYKAALLEIFVGHLKKHMKLPHLVLLHWDILGCLFSSVFIFLLAFVLVWVWILCFWTIMCYINFMLSNSDLYLKVPNS